MQPAFRMASEELFQKTSWWIGESEQRWYLLYSRGLLEEEMDHGGKLEDAIGIGINS